MLIRSFISVILATKVICSGIATTSGSNGKVVFVFAAPKTLLSVTSFPVSWLELLLLPTPLHQQRGKCARLKKWGKGVAYPATPIETHCETLPFGEGCVFPTLQRMQWEAPTRPPPCNYPSPLFLSLKEKICCSRRIDPSPWYATTFSYMALFSWRFSLWCGVVLTKVCSLVWHYYHEGLLFGIALFSWRFPFWCGVVFSKLCTLLKLYYHTRHCSLDVIFQYMTVLLTLSSNICHCHLDIILQHMALFFYANLLHMASFS